jgi:hypothetical protein
MINFYQLFLTTDFQNSDISVKILTQISNIIKYLRDQNLMPKFQPNFKIYYFATRNW